MPELPEVEEVRRTLEPVIIGAVVLRVRLLRQDYLTPPHAPLSRLNQRTIVATHRHGKKLFCRCNDGQTLMFHLGMSGRLEGSQSHLPVPLHTHFMMDLNSGLQIRMRDPRRFGGVWYYATFEQACAEEIQGVLGVDALNLTSAHLSHWRTASGRLKARLLGQRDVAGLGNIYVDEALWMSGLSPLMPVRLISQVQIVRLVQAIHRVLEKSLSAGGTTLRDYRNAAGQPGGFAASLRVYGRSGRPCFRCGGNLKMLVVAGRTTVFCRHCQKFR